MNIETRPSKSPDYEKEMIITGTFFYGWKEWEYTMAGAYNQEDEKKTKSNLLAKLKKDIEAFKYRLLLMFSLFRYMDGDLIK